MDKGEIMTFSVSPSWTRLLAPCWPASLLSGCGYNEFQTKDEATKAAWGEVVNQYQRRADLIPEPGQHGQGLCLARTRNAGSRHPRARRRHQLPDHAGSAEQSGSLPEVPAGAGRAVGAHCRA
jgi:hypothetical protein